jgi:RNA polymerase sigma factor (sigma-70 family)
MRSRPWPFRERPTREGHIPPSSRECLRTMSPSGLPNFLATQDQHCYDPVVYSDGKCHESTTMSDTPPFDDALRNALAGVDDDDVRIFYAYFEELKAEVRRHLSGKARTMPGTSAVAHSALLSMFADLAVHQIPLSDVDEYGYPMLWPLLLKYIERHCNKWMAYYRAKKRQGTETSLAVEPADHRADSAEESEFVDACEALYAKLAGEEKAVLEGRLRDETLEQIASRIGRSESTVSNILRRIREKLKA